MDSPSRRKHPGNISLKLSFTSYSPKRSPLVDGSPVSPNERKRRQKQTLHKIKDRLESQIERVQQIIELCKHEPDEEGNIVLKLAPLLQEYIEVNEIYVKGTMSDDKRREKSRLDVEDLKENEVRLKKAEQSLATGKAWRPDYSKCTMKV